MKARQFVVLRPVILLLCVSCVTSAQDATEPPFTLTQVGPNVWAAISNPKSKASAGANTGFVIGNDGVVVIDTTASFDADGSFGTAPAEHLLAAIRKLTTLPVRFVINTHYHLDHVGANAVFADAGATVLAHRNVRGWIHSENLRLLGDGIKPPQRAYIEAFVPPTVTYDQPVDLYLGSREIRVRSFPGHTGGDSVVVIPDAKVVFAGDLFWRDMLPNLIDASTQPWIDALDTLVKNEPDATFVPGHGDVGTAQDVVSFREYLATLRKLVSDAQAQKKSGEALADAVMPALGDKYSRWDGFQYLARPNILQMDAELSGKKRIPQPQSAK
ncbi:MAG: MBL fold metallo-hydrolase [Acidobacteria bacterium]|nr:MAG: MBL fold metallo-hydrolase [Acidobacteriota bacterium]